MDTTSVLFAVSTLTLIALGMTYAVKSKKLWLMSVVSICTFITPMSYYSMTILRNDHKGSTVPTLGTVTNGLYQVLATYEDGSGEYLSIVHRRNIGSIYVEKKTFDTVPADPLPILVRTEFPVITGTNILENYLIEVDGNKKTSTDSVREYDLFKHYRK